MKTDRFEKTFTTVPSADRTTRRRRRWIVGIAIILGIAASYLWFYAPQYLPASLAQYRQAQIQMSEAGGGGGRGLRGDGPVPVLAAVAKKADVPVFFDGVGSSRALNTVTVRPQVDGKLMSVNFKEGQDVDQDFVLAEIEATIYQAQYDQAVAKKAMDEAQLANARLDLERYARLTQTNSATRQQYDTQRALVAQLEAQVQADQGAIDNAKAILSYTRITAPLAGRTGIRQVDAGNIVHATDTTGIVVITQIRPIAVIFLLPQQRLAQVNKAFAQGPLSVQALGDDNRTVIDSGTLTVIDNQVDQATGTVKLKAEFPNKDLQIWPGQFVNVKLLVDTLRQVIVVPTAAVQRGPNGTFAYVANEDNTVTVRPVTVAQQDDLEAVIASGIDEGEQVVTTGFAQLTDGAKITIGAQEDLRRPAGSERRRGRPRETPQARSEPTPRAPLPAASAQAAEGKAGEARPAQTPSEGAAPQPGSAEQSRDTAQRTQSGGAATATP
ncbi:MAG TPA: efflux RND transporter periplasmic adaptor subunit [Xanthobacteraceae bacterium]|nr:efflux RND transporter periplasmic adaptor subunit [Xanthobacteraceae bacterium]